MDTGPVCRTVGLFTLQLKMVPNYIFLFGDRGNVREQLAPDTVAVVSAADKPAISSRKSTVPLRHWATIRSVTDQNIWGLNSKLDNLLRPLFLSLPFLHFTLYGMSIHLDPIPSCPPYYPDFFRNRNWVGTRANSTAPFFFLQSCRLSRHKITLIYLGGPWNLIAINYTEYPKNGTLFVHVNVIRLNFITYWPIFKLISLSESGERL